MGDFTEQCGCMIYYPSYRMQQNHIDVYETGHSGYFDPEALAGFLRWRNRTQVKQNISSWHDFFLRPLAIPTPVLQPLDTSITNEAHTMVVTNANRPNPAETEEQEDSDNEGLPDLEEILPYQGPLTLEQTVWMNELTMVMYGRESLPFTNELEVDVADRNNE